MFNYAVFNCSKVQTVAYICTTFFLFINRNANTSVFFVNCSFASFDVAAHLQTNICFCLGIPNMLSNSGKAQKVTPQISQQKHVLKQEKNIKCKSQKMMSIGKRHYYSIFEKMETLKFKSNLVTFFHFLSPRVSFIQFSQYQGPELD